MPIVFCSFQYRRTNAENSIDHAYLQTKISPSASIHAHKKTIEAKKNIEVGCM